MLETHILEEIWGCFSWCFHCTEAIAKKSGNKELHIGVMVQLLRRLNSACVSLWVLFPFKTDFLATPSSLGHFVNFPASFQQRFWLKEENGEALCMVEELLFSQDTMDLVFAKCFRVIFVSKQVRCNTSNTSASVSWGFPNTKKTDEGTRP